MKKSILIMISLVVIFSFISGCNTFSGTVPGKDNYLVRPILKDENTLGLNDRDLIAYKEKDIALNPIIEIVDKNYVKIVFSSKKLGIGNNNPIPKYVSIKYSFKSDPFKKEYWESGICSQLVAKVYFPNPKNEEIEIKGAYLFLLDREELKQSTHGLPRDDQVLRARQDIVYMWFDLLRKE